MQLIFNTGCLQSEKLLIFDLYAAMSQLVRRVLLAYCEPAVVNDQFQQLDHTNREHQLADSELAIGTSCRILLALMEEDSLPSNLKKFYR